LRYIESVSSSAGQILVVPIFAGPLTGGVFARSLRAKSRGLALPLL
jgi:hypothetical protein